MWPRRPLLAAQILVFLASLHEAVPAVTPAAAGDAAGDAACRLDPASVGASTTTPFETVPVFLKFHKVGSTTLTAMLQTLCHTEWWNATDASTLQAQQLSRDGQQPRAPKPLESSGESSSRSNNAAFCCRDPFWHQTIHQYRAAGGCALKACCLGWALGHRRVQLLALFREPRAKFVSGVYYFARWRNKQRLFGAPPANFSLAEFQQLAHASLEVSTNTKSRHPGALSLSAAARWRCSSLCCPSW